MSFVTVLRLAIITCSTNGPIGRWERGQIYPLLGMNKMIFNSAALSLCMTYKMTKHHYQALCFTPSIPACYFISKKGNHLGVSTLKKGGHFGGISTVLTFLTESKENCFLTFLVFFSFYNFFKKTAVAIT